MWFEQLDYGFGWLFEQDDGPQLHELGGLGNLHGDGLRAKHTLHARFSNDTEFIRKGIFFDAA